MIRGEDGAFAGVAFDVDAAAAERARDARQRTTVIASAEIKGCELGAGGRSEM
jgi:hypothetical protein